MGVFGPYSGVTQMGLGKLSECLGLNPSQLSAWQMIYLLYSLEFGILDKNFFCESREKC